MNDTCVGCIAHIMILYEFFNIGHSLHPLLGAIMMGALMHASCNSAKRNVSDTNIRAIIAIDTWHTITDIIVH